ncbi:MAG: hypothetical protein CBC56_003500 [Flavobacteriales bacterium TMED96]|nr:MAG: hypothetical protein CBC56_003500 [Flavobacteriales bacterium TMED96]
MNTVFLLGYMGCGKSILGKALASQVNIPFLDLDKKIEEYEKKNSTTNLRIEWRVILSSN